MILRVNPNRMELMRLRRRLSLAQRGHKLLEDKLEELMRRFIGLLKDIGQAEQDFHQRTQALLKDMFYCRITTAQDSFQESLSKINADIAVEVSTLRVMNVKVPEFKVQRLEFTKDYDFFKTSGQLDLVVEAGKAYIPSLLKLAQLLKTGELLSAEIERTRRRVNALQYLLIPSILATVSFIDDKLSEFERSNLVRLMRIKEIIRGH